MYMCIFVGCARGGDHNRCINVYVLDGPGPGNQPAEAPVEQGGALALGRRGGGPLAADLAAIRGLPSRAHGRGVALGRRLTRGELSDTHIKDSCTHGRAHSEATSPMFKRQPRGLLPQSKVASTSLAGKHTHPPESRPSKRRATNAEKCQSAARRASRARQIPLRRKKCGEEAGKMLEHCSREQSSINFCALAAKIGQYKCSPKSGRFGPNLAKPGPI